MSKVKTTLEWRDPKSLKNHPVNIAIYGDQRDEDFVASVKRHGVIDPPHILSKKVGKLPANTVVIGHKRRQAAIIAKLPKIQVLVRHDLDDEFDIQETLVESNRQRKKTVEEEAREFEVLKRVESHRADIRMKAKLKKGAETPAKDSFPDREGQARDLAAEKLGMSGKTAEKAMTVVEEIDRLDDRGHTRKADDLRDKLEDSVDAAHRQVSAKAKAKSSDGKPEPPKDQTGQLLPKHVAKAFECLPLARSLIARMGKMKTEMEELRLGPGGDHIHQHLVIDLDNVLTGIGFGIPYAICPYCEAKDSKCDGCDGRGWVTRDTWKMSPKVLSSKREAKAASKK